MNEDRGNYLPDQFNIDRIFTFRQTLGHGHTFHRHKINVFLELKAAFDSVIRAVLWYCLTIKNAPDKRISLISFL